MLHVSIQSSRSQIPASKAHQLIYLMLQIGPPSEFAISRLPLNICLVIDRSTSMRGERLEHVKRAASMVVEKLASTDFVSVVGYSDRAEVVVPATHTTNPTPILARIRGLSPSGGTEMFQGLHAGVNEMRKVDLASHLNHLVLLTDGHTYGDEAACLALSRKIVTEKIGVSAFGIGSEWNDRFLDKLVEPSGGQTGFIETPSQILEYLQQRIHNLGAVYANNVTLATKPFPNTVQLHHGMKLSPYAHPLTIDHGKINLGLIEGHTPVTLLLAFIVSPQETDATIRIPFHFMADIPSEQKKEQTADFYFEATVGQNAEPVEPPKELVDAVRMANLYRMSEKAQRDAEEGRLETVVKRMRNLTARMMEAGHQRLATQAHLETERLQMMGDLSQDGQKKLKFGTRALMAEIVSMNYA